MKTQPYNVFWQRIHQAARKKAFPLRVMFELTYQCNFRCAHCYVPQDYKKRPELKTKEIFTVLDELKDIGCFYLGFTGGEPFVRKDILDILWHAKKKGFEIIIYTNGSLINKNLADELKRLNPNKVDITISGMSPGVFDHIVRTAGARDKVFKAIDLLYKNRVALGFKTCVLKGNEGEIEDIQKFAHSLGGLHRLDDTLSARLDGSQDPFQYRGRTDQGNPEPDKSELECVRDKQDRASNKNSSKTRNLFPCGVGVSQAAITPAGELKMCVMIDHPRYKILTHPQTGLKSAWIKLKSLVASIQPDEQYRCGSCELKPYCLWCPAKAWLYKKDFTSCVPENFTSAYRRKNHAEKEKIPTNNH
ncbi:MAG: radical SAM protein [Candidatus Omnitrophica bacterium]|nr:radical SAM protein [Candidatus Omnitrophota bacterium]